MALRGGHDGSDPPESLWCPFLVRACHSSLWWKGVAMGWARGPRDRHGPEKGNQRIRSAKVVISGKADQAAELSQTNHIYSLEHELRGPGASKPLSLNYVQDVVVRFPPLPLAFSPAPAAAPRPRPLTPLPLPPFPRPRAAVAALIASSSSCTRLASLSHHC